MFEEEAHIKPKMNLTPLIDIIFLLVIFFMLSTSFVKLEALNMFVDVQDEPVKAQNGNLSAAQRAIKEFANQEAVLRADAEGFTVNGAQVSEAELRAVLNDAVARADGNKLSIEVSKGVSVQKLVELTDLAQSVGAKDVQIRKSAEQLTKPLSSQ